jgi:hypothetical protein
MKYLDEYRDAEAAHKFAHEIARITTRPWSLMEVCGGQTHAIVKFGIDELLPRQITLIHGPGCPVCVTPVELIDKALEIAARPEVIFCSKREAVMSASSIRRWTPCGSPNRPRPKRWSSSALASKPPPPPPRWPSIKPPKRG